MTMISSPLARLAIAISQTRCLRRSGPIFVRSCTTLPVISYSNELSQVPKRLAGCLLRCTSQLCYHQRRFKHKKKGTKVAEDDESDSDVDDEVEEPGSKIITGHMASLRADLVIKSGLGIARNKVETLFYESKIRVNGAKIGKKSQKVYIGDELDVIKGPVNDNMTAVSRVVVLSAKEHEDGDKLVVKMRRYKSLTIETE